ncbi:hypothetical protein B0H63DRAFT_486826 [Podospora didyma]|uniref:Phospholipid-transporting ATPase n=1 Tax=Podospora didyma TaxID=330526 RepID=A0AAE0K588_9PEZI|nr:hypothetical protein B0H63DRAFT_486826 [Podospora didyma]
MAGRRNRDALDEDLDPAEFQGHSQQVLQDPRAPSSSPRPGSASHDISSAPTAGVNLTGFPRAPLPRFSLSPAAARSRPPRTSLYTIESHTGFESPALEEPPQVPDDSASRDHRHGVRARRDDQSPFSLNPPRKTFDDLHGSVKSAMATAEETNATLSHYREWVDRQKKNQSRWGGLSWGAFPDRAKAAYSRVILKGLLRRKAIPPSKDGRRIPIEPGLARRKPLRDERTGRPYVSNLIRSSRYTVWDFLPKQLFFQFSKLANFYFLIIGILQMIPGLSTTGTFTTIAPLIAFVALSMAKEAYDDYRRYKLDKQENRSVAWVLDPDNAHTTERRGLPEFLKREKSGGTNVDVQMTELEDGARTRSGQQTRWAKLEWQDIRVGDIIQLRRDDNMPADIVLLHATGPNGVAYIETMALDGETNLKSKRACPLLAKHCDSIAAMASCDAEIVTEDPNLDLYNFEGRATMNGETMPLTMNEVVYRGSTLRNTTKAIGLVINTGEECKIRMNGNKNVKAKAPEMQYRVNRIVILLVGFVVLLALGCTMGYIMWRRNYEHRAWYLYRSTVPLTNIFVAFVIAFNTLIPLSLYVSLEIVKLGQAYLLNDIEMYDPVSDTPMVANTTTILENLGQVSYVFSDKTGTLTENLMRFRKMSVAGTAWLHDMDLQKEAAEIERKRKPSVYQDVGTKAGKGHKTSSPTSTTRFAGAGAMDEHGAEEDHHHGNAHPTRIGSISHWKSTARPGHAQPEMKTEDLIRFLRLKPNSPFSRKARQFILCLALCHTCLPETSEDGEVTFQSASPDELALVEAARDLGYLLVDRAAQSIKLQICDADGSTVTETYDILDVIEFSSDRKRMSIVVRMPDGKLCLFSKGADSVILPRLKQSKLTTQAVSAVSRRASVRKSLELEKALRRQSLNSVKRESMNIIRAAGSSIDRRDPRVTRKSAVFTGEVASWLEQRENDGLGDELQDDDIYQTPRASMARGRSMDLALADDSYDAVVDEAIAMNDAAVFERCFQHVHDFASEGLRTLIFAYRYLEEDDYRNWKTVYHEATTSLVNRQERIEAAAEIIEQNFDLAGATAIEDKLQQGVPETIDKFRRANIKVWMLTGDKRETAINIAHSTRICKPFSEIYVLDSALAGWEEHMADALVAVGRGMAPHSVIVIDGHTLGLVEADEVLRALFFDLAVRVDSVICCRASPSQKATLVRYIRHQVPSAVTLAIGDGANDIAMIQASHVGIGISGREGLQAARISDYSIAQFRFLQRLLFVHGRWNYIRTGKYIVGTFWKEVVFYLVQAQFQRFNGYTGTSLFEPTSLTVFNTLFTSLPVILLGILEKDLSADTLIAVPELYTFGQKNKGFNFKQWLGWMFMAVSSSVIIFFSVYCLYGTSHYPVDTSLYAMGTLAFSLAVIFINIKMLVLELHDRTVITFSGLAISVSGWFLWNVGLSLIMPHSPGPYVVRGSFTRRFGRNGLWWLVHFITLSALIVFDVAVSSVRKSLWPTDQDLMQEMEHIDGIMDVMREHALEHGDTSSTYPLDDRVAAGLASKKGGDDAASIKSMGASSAASFTSPEHMAGFHFGPSRSTSVVSKRGSRYMTEEVYIPPPFTPPAEERENPMDSGAGGGGCNKPTTIPTITEPLATQSGQPFHLTQSPIELQTSPARRKPWPLP